MFAVFTHQSPGSFPGLLHFAVGSFAECLQELVPVLQVVFVVMPLHGLLLHRHLTRSSAATHGVFLRPNCFDTRLRVRQEKTRSSGQGNIHPGRVSRVFFPSFFLSFFLMKIIPYSVSPVCSCVHLHSFSCQTGFDSGGRFALPNNKAKEGVSRKMTQKNRKRSASVTLSALKPTD